jgi:RNA polymerase sigma-70 factor (ECF subfamily)
MVDELSLEQRMSLAQAGDKVAYESVLREIAPLIRNFISKFNYKNLIDVDDITQEALLAIHQSSHTFQSDRSFKNWAFAIANYKLKDHLRSIYRKKKLTEINFAEVEDFLFEEVDFGENERPSLDSMLHVLKPKAQQIIRFLKIEGNSLEEAANKMNMTVAAVKVSAHRSYEILIKKFGKK